MKALLVLPLVILGGCATSRPLSATTPAAEAARQAYVQCAHSTARGLQGSGEEARQVALTAVGVCRPKLVALAEVVEDANRPDPMRQVFAHEYVNALRDKVLAEVAASVMRDRASKAPASPVEAPSRGG